MQQNLFISLFTFSILINGLAAGVTYELNPGCHNDTGVDCCTQPWLISVTNRPSADNTSVYHHLWGAMPTPTVLTAHTSHDAKLHVDWDMLTNYKPGSLTFQPDQLKDVFGIAITELVLYDDQEDVGGIENIPINAQLSVPVGNFTWEHSIQNSDNSSVTLSLYTVTFNNETMPEDQRIVVTVKNTESESRADERPRLLARASTSTVDLVLDNLTINMTNPHPSKGGAKTRNHKRVAPISQFTAPRWAVRAVLFSNESNGTIIHSTTLFLDDEYAPGVFQMDELTTPLARESSIDGGYMQWRPVCYLTEKRDVTKSTIPNFSIPSSITNSSEEMHLSLEGNSSFQKTYLSRFLKQRDEVRPLTNVSKALQKSLAYALFGEQLTQMLSVETMISFGATDDGYYTTYNYAVWTFTIGSGFPPKDSLSTTVLIVILVGFCIPLLILITAIVAFTVKKLSVKKTDSHSQSLIEEEA